jgi:hypothetical protein
MTITNPLDLNALRLDKGQHTSFEQGACLLEAAAYMAGEPWSDHPACVSPVLGAFGRALNDLLPDDKRQALVPLVPRLIGTAGDGQDQVRGLMAADWLLRVYTPTWLRLAGLTDQAEALEGLPRQVSWDDVEATVPVVREAKVKASVAGAAAGAVAWDAAWDVARDVDWDAARDVARDVAWDAARDAARAAARDALQPTVIALQESAIKLYAQMARVGKT